MLDLASSSRIHPVGHVSLLRPYFGSDPKDDFCPLSLQDKIPFLENHRLSDSQTDYLEFPAPKRNTTGEPACISQTNYETRLHVKTFGEQGSDFQNLP